VEIHLPPLRDRAEDIHLLFRKFASDFAVKYKMPTIKIDDDAIPVLLNYPWNGNIRQLKNITEQLSVIEQNRNISKEVLQRYLPAQPANLPAVIKDGYSGSDFSNEREILYKVLFDMRNDINDLKNLTKSLSKENYGKGKVDNSHLLMDKDYDEDYDDGNDTPEIIRPAGKERREPPQYNMSYEEAETVDESVSLQEKELEMIKKSLERNKGKRKLAAKELGISERTLYRKLKQFDL